jgi:hypothetical protein
MNTVAVTFVHFFFLKLAQLIYGMLVAADILLYSDFFSAATFVSHILQYKMSPSDESISSTNWTTICLKWHDLDSFALGIVIKWITLAQHKTELFTLRNFRQLYLCVYGQGREGEDRMSFIEQ